MKIILWVFGLLIATSVSLSLLLMIPSVQQFVVNKAAVILSNKSGTEVSVGSIRIGFPKTVKIGGVFIGEGQTDTLFYCKDISVDLALLALAGNKIHADYLGIDGVKVHILQNEDSTYNFSSLFSAFGSNKKSGNTGSSEIPEISIDEIEFLNIRADYKSLTDSSQINMNLGRLQLVAEEIDLAENKFHLREINIKNTAVSTITGRKTEKDSIKKKTALPELSLDELNLENFRFDLKTVNGDIDLAAELKEANLQIEKTDPGNFALTLKKLETDELKVALKLRDKDSVQMSLSPGTLHYKPDSTGQHAFGNINPKIFIQQISLKNTEYTMDRGSTPRKPVGTDYKHLSLSGINILADSVFFDRDSAGFHARSITLKDVSGPEITRLSGVFFMDNTKIRGKNLVLQTPLSHLEGSVYMTFPGLRYIGQKTESVEIRSELSGQLSTADLEPFYSMPDTFPSVANIGSLQLENVKTFGTLNNFTIERLSLSADDAASIKAQAEVSGLLTGELTYDFSIDTLFASGVFLSKIGADRLLPAGIEIPGYIGLKGRGEQHNDQMLWRSEVCSEVGNLSFTVGLNNDQFDGKVEIPSLNIGIIAGIGSMGEISLESELFGKLEDRKIKEFSSETEVFSLLYNNITIKNTEAKIDLRDGIYHIEAEFADPDLKASLSGFAQPADSINHFELRFDPRHVDIGKLRKGSKEPFVISGNMYVNADYAPGKSLSGKFESKNLSLRKAENRFLIEQIDLTTNINRKYTNFDLSSDIINATLSGNTNVFELKTAFINHLSNYLSLPDSILNEKDYDFTFDLSLKKPEFFTDFLVDNLHELSVEQFHAKYNRKTDLFEADIRIPKIVYGKFNFDEMAVNINSKSDSTVSLLRLGQLTYDSALIKNIRLGAKFAKQQAMLSLLIRDGNDSLKYRLATDLQFRDSVYYFSLLPKRTIIDYHQWHIDPNNSFRIYPDGFNTHNASMSFRDEKIWLETDNDTIKLNFENFRIQNISGFLEKDRSERIFKGRLNGNIKVGSIFSDLYLSGDMLVSDIMLRQDTLGELSGNFRSLSSGSTDFSFSLQNDVNRISAAGELTKRDQVPYLNINLESDIGQTEVFAPLAEQYLENLSGGLTGRLAVFGRVDAPTLNGQLSFNKLNTTVRAFNTRLKTNGTLIVDNNLITFNNFNIRDSLNNDLNIRGKINAREISNPIYDVHISSKDFTAVNTHPREDENIIGKILLGAEIDIQGRQNELTVKSDITVNEGTDIMYVFPGKDLELINDEGIVDFVDFDSPVIKKEETAKKKFIADSIASTFKGIDLTVNLSINPQAKFGIYIDPNSGDITYFRLKGSLNYRYNEVRRGYLTGRLELEEGYYDLSFYGLVKKKFVYIPGSSINWSGDVMNGDINFSAKYTVETNSVGLVSNEISGYEKSMYNQRLPYDVILFVKNSISEPQISFGIDLPSRYRSSYPIIDSKLKTLNSESLESERNKQVFALLVGGTFIPESSGTSDGGSDRNFATTAARNSINSIFTQQLNNLTGQFIKVVDLDMGVNTFDDYSTGRSETRTQLDLKVSKQMFNNRVSAEVESHIDLEGSNPQPGEQSTMGLPEFAVTYNLTEKGNYRIKAFRENYYDMYDGEISNSGFAFIFVRDFDSFRKKDKNRRSDSNEKKPKNK